MPNDINSVSPTIRDFLLNRNLILSDTITKNGLSSVASGLGGLSPVETVPNAVQASEDIEVSSETYRKSQIIKNPYSSTDDVQFASISNQNVNTGNLPPNTPSVEYGKFIGSTTDDSVFNNISNDSRDLQTLKNRYISSEDMVSATIINNSFAYNQTDGGYLNEHGKLNLGGPSTDTLDAVGSILSQKGFGLSGNGIDSQFDIRTSLAGRVLGATGVINDTPLGIIGGQQLLLALGQKAAFNAQKEILGKVNLQPFSLITGSSLINPNYDITVRSTTGGKILDKISEIGGYEHPNSVINPEASIFYENTISTSQVPTWNFNHLPNQGSTERNKTLIENTGKGQATVLYNTLNSNLHKPDYTVDGDSSNGVKDPLVYEAENIGLDELNEDGTKYIWGQDEGETRVNTASLSGPRTLLGKTKILFDNNKNLQKVLFTNDPITDNRSLETSTPGTWLQGAPLYSKGSGVVGPDGNTFCRTWTSTNRYDSISNLQKNTGLINYNDRIRDNITDSVLGNNGFAKISPYRIGDANTDTDDVKKYMFSIENLAWSDNLNMLPDIEIGNGDLVSGTKGRIMWFPPYGINFTDTTAVDWDTSKFIGRGEPIYTYNSTERSGTLEFQIIIDYPDYMNNNLINTDEIFASIAAGCTDYDSLFTTEEMAQIEAEVNIVDKSKNVKVSKLSKLPNVTIYFDNDISTVDLTYEDVGTEKNPVGLDKTVFEYGLNRPWLEIIADDNLKKLLNTDYSNHKINITGFASIDGITQAATGQDKTSYNQDLSEKRAKAVYQWVLANLDDKSNPEFKNRVHKLPSKGDTQATNKTDVSISPTYSFGKKSDRKVTIEFVYDSKLDIQVTNATEVATEKTKESKELISKIKSRFYDEGKYFKELLNSDSQSDKMVYKSIREKIGFFQPAFHSITPEGFNARLTFLQQCTRQGPTNKGDNSNNLAFGMAPVCILRIGDFYHTKIIINSLALTYEPLVWDLNPEGIGVQPMIAKATINFKFIGGSALKGPINKLQNAVSFNYFANTEVYDTRADRLIKNKDGDYVISSGNSVTSLNTNYIDNEVQGLDLTKPNSNQEAVSELELTKEVEVTEGNDATELNLLSIWSNNPYIEGDDFLTIQIKYNNNIKSTYTLTKQYTGKVYLKSTKEPTLNLYLGLLTIRQNNPNDLIIESADDNTSGIIYNNGESTVSVEIDLTNLPDNVQSKLLELTKPFGGGGHLQLVWPTGSKSNVNLYV